MKNLIKILMIALFVYAFEACVNTEQPTKILQNKWVVITDTISLYINSCLIYPNCRWTNDSTIISFIPDNDSTYKLEYVIKDSLAYSKLINTKYTPNCNTLPKIDFNNFTLLGKFTKTRGDTMPIITKSVTINDSLKKVHYQINHIRIGLADIPIYRSMNWMIVPKIPNGYTVEFGIHINGI